MKENEVIIVDQISEDEYNTLSNVCAGYAIISKPFTIRRIGGQTLNQAILNIYKGKLAEALFWYFCRKNQIELDWETPLTPFWQIDKRDFIFQDTEWDIKNNFIYHPGEPAKAFKYTDLPALVPNKKLGDQWDARKRIKNKNICSKTGFIFSYLKGAELLDGKRVQDFCNINLTPEQADFLQRAEQRYLGRPAPREPFLEEFFWKEMDKRGDNNYVTLNFQPNLIITGYATEEHWHLFKNTGPKDQDNNFQSDGKKQWYVKTSKGTLNFLNGSLWATINNATAPVKELPSFLSLFPQLKENMVLGHFAGK
jgi:hypothetical protein